MFRVTEFIVFKLTSWMIHWLKNHSSSKIKNIENIFNKGGTQSIHRQESVQYKADIQTSLERFDSNGSAGDYPQLRTEGFNIPLWVKEIPTFLSNQLSDHTRKAYENDLRHFFSFLNGKIAPEAINRLMPEHIIMYRRFLEEGRVTGSPLAKTTINRKLASVKSFLNWLKLNHLLRENPALLVKGFPQNQESSLNGLSDEEAKKILLLPRTNSKSGALHCAVLHVLLYMGLRKSELTGLKIGDMTEERGIPVLKVRGKGHKVRVLAMTPVVRASLENYFYVCRRNKADQEAPLFTPTKNNSTRVFMKALNPNAISYMVLRYAKKAGVLKVISPHSCRATCISNALDKKATHRSVQYLAGWSTPLMIQRYDKRREDLHHSAAFLIDYGENKTASAGTA